MKRSHTHKKRNRKDKFGTKIVRGMKEHKICFIDEACNKDIAKVHYVESYKEFYQ